MDTLQKHPCTPPSNGKNALLVFSLLFISFLSSMPAGPLSTMVVEFLGKVVVSRVVFVNL